MERALIDGAIAKETDNRLRQIAHHHGISDADGDRIALADDRVTAHEAALAIEHVHGAAHAAGHPTGAAE